MVVERVDGNELRFKNPGRLLLVVIGFLFWAIGFIDLIGHTSAETDVFGLYSLPFFIFLIVYGSTIVIWFVLFFNSNLLSHVAEAVKYIQAHTWISVIIVVGIGISFWVIFEWDRWSRLPGLQLSAFGLAVWALLILLFANWNDSKGQQKWRKVIAYPLIALLILEAVIQLVTWFGVLPGTYTIGGDFVPYERLYNNAEGYRNDFANRNGWTFPDVEMDDEKKRILVVGGSFVQALQVEPGQQFSMRLKDLINQSEPEDNTQADIIAIGLPGFGLSPFLFDEVIQPPNPLDYDELIIMYHLGDDFQSPLPSHNAISYSVSESGKVEVKPEDARLRHDLTHYYLRGFFAFQPVETLRSNYLTPIVIQNLIFNPIGEYQTFDKSDGNLELEFSRLVGFVDSSYAVTERDHAGIKTTNIKIIPEGNNFIFNKDNLEGRQEAMQIASSILESAQEIARANDIKLKLVTIPVFPDGFYSTYQTGDWEPLIGDYDLFSPEFGLIEIAKLHNIPILPMGQQMIADQLTVEGIKKLYFSNGQGHLTTEGHQYFAESIFSCFYSEEALNICVK